MTQRPTPKDPLERGLGTLRIPGYQLFQTESVLGLLIEAHGHDHLKTLLKRRRGRPLTDFDRHIDRNVFDRFVRKQGGNPHREAQRLWPKSSSTDAARKRIEYSRMWLRLHPQFEEAIQLRVDRWESDMAASPKTRTLRKFLAGRDGLEI